MEAITKMVFRLVTSIRVLTLNKTLVYLCFRLLYRALRHTVSCALERTASLKSLSTSSRMIFSLDDIEAYISAVVKVLGKRFDFRIGGQSG